ncbi:MAG: hypothetical protein PUB22_05630 [Clostridiales bacterium]|nr:hypothetical protein [Clostridiales bacterium]
MIVYGIRMWKRIAYPALFFMIVSAFLLFQSLQLDTSLKEDVKQYGRITCVLGEQQPGDISQNLLENGSYVYEAEAVFQYQSFEKEYLVTGISSNMIPGEMLCGDFYSDDSNKISVVVNKAMITDLTGKEPKTDEELADWIDTTFIMGDSAVTLCGVIEDETMSPSVYMSIPAVCSYMQQHGETPDAGYFCISVLGLKQMEQIQQEMSAIGIGMDIDQEKMMEWKIKEVRIRDLIIMSLTALWGFASNIMLAAKMRIRENDILSKTMMAASIVVNGLIGIIVGLLIFGFVQIWMH